VGIKPARLLGPTLFVLLLAVLTVGAGGAQAALTLEKVGPKFAQPIYLASDPGDADRLFVVEREGTIQLLENGVVSAFADLTAEVNCGGGCEGERGLLSIALAPDFDSSGRLFADYAKDGGDGTIHVAELTAPGPAHDSATLTRQLLEIDHSQAANHNGGQLQFGPDGFLYASTGDGGSGNDLFHHSQDPNSQLGKILRIDSNAMAPVTPTIWSLGLRNPYRFSFDALSGDMVIGDVGEKAHEEIDLAPSPLPGVVGGQGVNYGWNCREGLFAGIGDDLKPGECASKYAAGAFVDPVFEYGHDPDPDLGLPNRCSITGGYVVRDQALGALDGAYVYSDYCSGVVRALRLPSAPGAGASGDCSLGLRLAKPVSFGEDAARRLYAVEQSGQVYRFSGQPTGSCPAPLPPTEPKVQPPSTQSPPATPAKAAAPTFIGIRAQRGRVERDKQALLTVFVSPCEGRLGQSVELLRNGRANGSKRLNRACSVRFTPRIGSAASFAATTREERGYLPGASRQLRIRLAPPPRPALNRQP
jgi:hypothetical protein